MVRGTQSTPVLGRQDIDTRRLASQPNSVRCDVLKNSRCTKDTGLVDRYPVQRQHVPQLNTRQQMTARGGGVCVCELHVFDGCLVNRWISGDDSLAALDEV